MNTLLYGQKWETVSVNQHHKGELGMEDGRVLDQIGEQTNRIILGIAVEATTLAATVVEDVTMVATVEAATLVATVEAATLVDSAVDVMEVVVVVSETQYVLYTADIGRLFRVAVLLQ